MMAVATALVVVPVVVVLWVAFRLPLTIDQDDYAIPLAVSS